MWVNWDTFAAAGTAALAESSQALRSGSCGEVASTDVAMMLSLLNTAVPLSFSFAFLLFLQSLLGKACLLSKNSVDA